jgi:hypothetical protein
MDIKSILESLERTDSIWELLTLTPIVGPGAVISNNLKWSSRFSEGKAAFYNGEYAQAAHTFRELNEDIPRHDKFLISFSRQRELMKLSVGHVLAGLQSTYSNMNLL